MLKGIAWALAALGLIWAGAFLRFTADLPRAVPDPERRTDGIVVLTGGANRIEAGLGILAASPGMRLFVSGVDPSAHRGDFEALMGRPDLFACCIDLGFAATDTASNARETAQWARAGRYRSLRIVTSSYHMPRSLLELRRQMPEVELVPHPVFAGQIKIEQWWRWPGTAGLLVGEFHKYLAALLRARLGPSPPPDGEIELEPDAEQDTA
jgi:uncharacterized SAM-binding protein YcdF (DUF218 family)